MNAKWNLVYPVALILLALAAVAATGQAPVEPPAPEEPCWEFYTLRQVSEHHRGEFAVSVAGNRCTGASYILHGTGAYRWEWRPLPYAQ